MKLYIHHEDKVQPIAEIDLECILMQIPDKDRLELVRIICTNISEVGFIGPIRDLVNSSDLND